MLARGWSSRAVALASYTITLLIAAIALRTVGRAGATVTIFLIVFVIAGATSGVFAGIDRLRAVSLRAKLRNSVTEGEFLTSK